MRTPVNDSLLLLLLPAVNKPCDDGLICTVNTTCSNGVCQGSQRQCPALTGDDKQCMESYCNPAAATDDTACQERPKPENTTCISPLEGCSRDSCQAGVCVQGLPAPDCSALDTFCAKFECIDNRCVKVPRNGKLPVSCVGCIPTTETYLPKVVAVLLYNTQASNAYEIICKAKQNAYSS